MKSLSFMDISTMLCRNFSDTATDPPQYNSLVTLLKTQGDAAKFASTLGGLSMIINDIKANDKGIGGVRSEILKEKASGRLASSKVEELICMGLE
ncbi:unnamed protein product, partial [Iphiclides podalirius]